MNGAGWSPLFVFETESGQVVTYRVTPRRQTPGSTKPEVRDRSTAGSTAVSAEATTESASR